LDTRRCASKRRRPICDSEGRRGLLTISVGLARSHGLGQTAGHLLQRADQALYQAKAAGRDRTVVDG